jgi:hypothetical protein
MMLLWFWLGWLRPTLIINMVKLHEITISESSVVEPEPHHFRGFGVVM